MSNIRGKGWVRKKKRWLKGESSMFAAVEHNFQEVVVIAFLWYLVSQDLTGQFSNCSGDYGDILPITGDIVAERGE
jgi:hypothetical protein